MPLINLRPSQTRPTLLPSVNCLAFSLSLSLSVCGFFALSLKCSPLSFAPSFCHLAINFAPINTPCFWLRQICGTPLVNIDEAAEASLRVAWRGVAWHGVVWLGGLLASLLPLLHSPYTAAGAATAVDGLLPKLCCSLCSAAAAVASFD